MKSALERIFKSAREALGVLLIGLLASCTAAAQGTSPRDGSETEALAAVRALQKESALGAWLTAEPHLLGQGGFVLDAYFDPAATSPWLKMNAAYPGKPRGTGGRGGRGVPPVAYLVPFWLAPERLLRQLRDADPAGPSLVWCYEFDGTTADGYGAHELVMQVDERKKKFRFLILTPGASRQPDLDEVPMLPANVEEYWSPWLEIAPSR